MCNKSEKILPIETSWAAVDLILLLLMLVSRGDLSNFLVNDIDTGSCYLSIHVNLCLTREMKSFFCFLTYNTIFMNLEIFRKQSVKFALSPENSEHRVRKEN